MASSSLYVDLVSPFMRRLIFMIAGIFASVTIFGAATAHPIDLVACMDTSTAISIGHNSSDADQVPGDAEKGYPHHHAGCHDHQVCSRVTGTMILGAFHTAKPRSLNSSRFVVLATTDPALRPPIA